MRSGKPERFFFIPKGALTHHLVGTDSISFAMPFEAELTQSVVPPLPQKSCDFPGPLSAVVFPLETVLSSPRQEPPCGGCAPKRACGRSPRGMRLLRQPDGQCHISDELLSLSTQLVRSILTEYRRFNRRYFTNCPHKPATAQGTPFGRGSFVCGYDYHYC